MPGLTLPLVAGAQVARADTAVLEVPPTLLQPLDSAANERAAPPERTTVRRQSVVPPPRSGEGATLTTSLPPADPGESAPTSMTTAPIAPQARSGGSSGTRDLTRAPDDIWTRIRNGFSLPDLDGPLVREQEAWYAARPEYIQRTILRSQRYLFYIVDEVQKRGMPLEIALLPIIESAYNPQAYSRSHASGIWQFIPSTGKEYGLEQNWWHDQRRDVLAATRAALDYLEKLYDQFGSWDLALAAYNWGEGSVGRAIQRNEARGLPTDYQNLQSMPNETRQYVPKLQAVKNIIADPARFNIQIPPVPNAPYFTTVSIDRPMDVRVAARLAEMPVDEFLALNPAHNRPVIRAESPRALLVPADRADRFAQNLGMHDQSLVTWQAYTVQRGEGVDRIARKFNTSPSDLRQVNGIADRRSNLAGMTILVPTPAGSAAPNLDVLPVIAQPETKATHSPPVAAAASHVVRAGETLFQIARRYGVTPAQLAAWNNLPGERVTVGQRLTLKTAAAVPAAVAKESASARAKGTVAQRAKPSGGKTAKSAKSAAPAGKRVQVALNRR
jgi:membrane-bound lytic murein transglycosylase D